ncbi:hypothetical protein J6590_025992, partial [Homalodisca vitripennis]
PVDDRNSGLKPPDLGHLRPVLAVATNGTSLAFACPTAFYILWLQHYAHHLINTNDHQTVLTTYQWSLGVATTT